MKQEAKSVPSAGQVDTALDIADKNREKKIKKTSNV